MVCTICSYKDGPVKIVSLHLLPIPLTSPASTLAASKDRHLFPTHVRQHFVDAIAYLQMLHSAETIRPRKSRKLLQASLLVLDPWHGTYVKGVPVHLQDTPFTHTELYSFVYVSVCVDGRHNSPPRLLSFTSLQATSLCSRHHSVMCMHLEQNRKVVENQRVQGFKSG